MILNVEDGKKNGVKNITVDYQTTVSFRIGVSWRRFEMFINCPHCGKQMVKHIVKEGARYHVASWDYHGAHCSEPDCEKNHGVGKCVPLTAQQEIDRRNRKLH